MVMKKQHSLWLMIGLVSMAGLCFADVDVDVRESPTERSLTTSASIESLIDSKAAELGGELRMGGIRELVIRVEGTFEDALRNKIMNALRSALMDQGLQVAKTGRAKNFLVVTVKMVPPKTDQDKPPYYTLGFAVHDSNQQPQGPPLKFTLEQKNSEELARELAVPMDQSDRRTGATSPLPASVVDAAVVGYLDPDTSKVPLVPGSAKPNNQAPQTALRPNLGQLPQQHIQDGVVYAKKDGMFGIQIRSNDKPLRHSIYRDGLAMVEFKSEEYYEVALYNHAPFDVLVNLQIDGVDSGFFSKTKRLLWYIPAGKSTVIRGWQKDSETANKFSIVAKEDSLAYQQGFSMNVGTVHANFFRAFNNQEELLKDPEEAKLANTRGPVGTGVGPEHQAKVLTVQKIPGAMRAGVSIRYDRTANE